MPEWLRRFFRLPDRSSAFRRSEARVLRADSAVAEWKRVQAEMRRAEDQLRRQRRG